MQRFIRVSKALSDPNRVKILKMLQHKVMCVCELTEALGLAQSTVSNHLRLLQEADLITFTRDGLWVDYRLSKGAENPYAASLLGNLRHWLDDDPEIAALVARLPDINREVICAR